MSRPQATTQFYLDLLEFLLSSKQHVLSIGAEHDLSSMQTPTLLLLDEEKPRPMKSLCSIFHCDPSNVTGIVDGLEQKGLVERQSDPRDRRIKTLQIRPSGKKLQQRILNDLVRDNSSVFAPLTDEETEQLIHIVKKLAAANRLT